MKTKKATGEKVARDVGKSKKIDGLHHKTYALCKMLRGWAVM